MYAALSIDTGRLMAVKEIEFAPEDAEASGGLGVDSDRTAALAHSDEAGASHDRSATVPGEVVLQLEREVELLATLSHPNVVRFLGSERGPTAMYIFLEYVAGGRWALF